MLPFNGITIPVPVIEGKDDPPPVRFGEVNSTILGVSGKNVAASWNGHKIELAGGFFPVVSSGDLTAAQTKSKVSVAYGVSLDFENGIDVNVPFDGAFELALVWRAPAKKLAVRIKRSGTQEQFINLDAASG
jgi:hypothetical protein